MRARKFGRLIYFGMNGSDVTHPALQDEPLCRREGRRRRVRALARARRGRRAASRSTSSSLVTSARRRSIAPRQQAVPAKNPTGHAGSWEDVAYAVRVLAADDASFLNGVVLRVSGGSAERVRVIRFAWFAVALVFVLRAIAAFALPLDRRRGLLLGVEPPARFRLRRPSAGRGLDDRSLRLARPFAGLRALGFRSVRRRHVAGARGVRDRAFGRPPRRRRRRACDGAHAARLARPSARPRPTGRI